MITFNMGRVSRYKREKKTFDVDNLFSNNSSRDDPLSKKSTRLRGKDAKAARGKLLRKFDADGKQIDPPKKRENEASGAATSKKRKSPSDANENGKDGKTEMDRAGFKIDGRRAGESYKDFIGRVNRETQEELTRQRKSSSKTAAKGKAYLRRRKEKEREKKEAKRREREGDMEDKEREIYKQDDRNKRRRVNDVADAPPEFEAAHELRKRKSNPSTNRDRFAKLSFSVPSASGSSSTSSGAGAGNGSKSDRQRSDYEKLQLQQMREQVQARYSEIRQRRRDASSLK